MRKIESKRLKKVTLVLVAVFVVVLYITFMVGWPIVYEELDCRIVYSCKGIPLGKSCLGIMKGIEYSDGCGG